MGGTVLIVDPNDALRQHLGDLLEAHGYAVLEAGDGISAWAVACNHRPDLITVRDPAKVYGARSLLDSIRANVTMEDIPVLIVSSAGTQTEDWQERDAVVRQLDPDSRPEEFVRAVGDVLSTVGPDEIGPSSAEIPVM
jgi:CheY-like chemotaxis protein